jgi:DNA-directed RNA polymerase II subunit RPB11
VKQDHTLANLVRGCVRSTRLSLPSPAWHFFSQLLSMPQVLFAGYKAPHPLHPYFLVKIQTDGTITPTAALEQACTKLIGTLSSLEAKFKREFSFKDVEGVTTEDAYGTSTAGPAWTSGRDYMDF